MKVDKSTMAHSLEARVPFLDHKIVEFIYSLPRGHKLQGEWYSKNKSNEKILSITKNIDNKLNNISKIQNEVEKQKFKIERIQNFIQDRITLLNNNELIKCSICLDDIDKNSSNSLFQRIKNKYYQIMSGGRLEK